MRMGESSYPQSKLNLQNFDFLIKQQFFIFLLYFPFPFHFIFLQQRVLLNIKHPKILQILRFVRGRFPGFFIFELLLIFSFCFFFCLFRILYLSKVGRSLFQNNRKFLSKKIELNVFEIHKGKV